MKDNPQTDSSSPAAAQPAVSTRPAWITALCLLIALISAYHVLRFIEVLQNWDFLKSQPLLVSPLYLALSGFFWGVSGLILVPWLWKGSPRGRTAGNILAVLFAAAAWIDILLAAAPSLLNSRWPFYLFSTLLGLGFSLISLNHPASRKFFNR
ncbi:MAG: hypothetical protein U5K99_05645 [Anaerolineales bacterium]|nr:hypothetical protein [Anaerolineales bacterium]